MTEDYTRADLERERKARQEQERKNAQEREKAAAYRSWVQAGGDPASFEREWGKMADEWRRKRILEADEAARETQRNAGISGI